MSLNRLVHWKVEFQSLSDISKDFLRIPISTGDFGTGTQKDIIVNFEEQFSACKNGMGRGYLL